MGRMNRIIETNSDGNSELIKETTLDKLLASKKKITIIKIDV